MKKIILSILLISSTFTFGQRKYAADRYFKEFAYSKSAELYESLYKRGDSSFTVLSRLGDSHYFNVNTQDAEKWYEKLMKTKEGIASKDHIFRYAQSLKSNGKVTESDTWMRKLPSRDSRVKELTINKDYFVNYTNKEKTYVNIHNVSTNTKFSDFGGFIKGDEFYFASTRPEGTDFDKRLYKWNNQPFLNIYKANNSYDESTRILEVSDAEKLAGVNTRYHESNVIFTKDGNTKYFTRDNYDGNSLEGDKKRVTHLKIYKATKSSAGNWSKVTELPFNNNDYSCGHPALSTDEKTLYFVSDMPNGFGATDIYKVAITNTGYGKVENLGNTINTEGREMFPFIGSNDVLYFSSDGHLGIGALDIFESKLSGSSYTKPKNVGAPVNSPLDDFSFVINQELSKGFFSSNRKGGKGDDDIYSFAIYKCKESFDGIVTDSKTTFPIEGAVVELIDAEGKVVAQQTTTATGNYNFGNIECEQNFVIRAAKKDYRNDQKESKTIDVDQQVIAVNLQLEPLIVADQIVIKPIYFDFDLYNIREDAEYELEHIVDVMKNHPNMVIRIESHTDSRGTKAYNERLSTNRAKSTRDYIISRGIAANRIQSAKGFGEYQLLNHCNDANQKKCTKEEHQLNRRSYFYIVSDTKNVKVINQSK